MGKVTYINGSELLTTTEEDECWREFERRMWKKRIIKNIVICIVIVAVFFGGLFAGMYCVRTFESPKFSIPRRIEEMRTVAVDSDYEVYNFDGTKDFIITIYDFNQAEQFYNNYFALRRKLDWFSTYDKSEFQYAEFFVMSGKQPHYYITFNFGYTGAKTKGFF